MPANFVRLTNAATGKPMLVNADHIRHYAEYETGKTVMLTFTGQDVMQVRGDLESVSKILAESKSARHG
jgi:hypothetical protein